MKGFGVLFLLVCSWGASTVGGFSLLPVQSRRSRTSSRLFVSQSHDSDGATMTEKERMEWVRNFQTCFYETHSHPPPCLDTTTGIMHNLPLLRMPYVELPGRSNLLNIQEPQYTHMFEQLLRSPQPWYFGSLYLAGGSQNLKASPLVTYKQDTLLGAQVGCLMRIRDYRRTQDGGLVLFVQALERFVVDQVVQSLPYSMAHVQILPDIASDAVLDESVASKARAKQVQTSFQYHKYEFADTKLPFPQSEYLDTNTEVGMDTMKILSFSFYNQDDSILENVLEQTNDEYKHDEHISSSSPSLSLQARQPSLERELLEKGILKEPSAANTLKRSADECERQIWLALQDYSQIIQAPLPEQALCLKPPELHLSNLPDARHAVSPNYPKERRQHRLSYTAASLLNNIHLWQDLLELPSTKARLEAVLLQLHQRQDAIEGMFQ